MASARLGVAHRKLARKVSRFETFEKDIQKQLETDRVRKMMEAFPKLLIVLHCPTQLYLFLFCIIPQLFVNYSRTTQYCLQFLVCFCCLNGLVNYILCATTTSYVTSEYSKKVKYSTDDRVLTIEHALSRIQVLIDNGELLWRFCNICNMNTPPRSHHCKYCKRCILKRDHHCPMVGNCIGFYNQKYFFVLGFYAVINGLLAAVFNAWYLYTFYWPTAYSWTSLVLPVGVLRFLFNYEEIEPHIMLLLIQIYPQIFFGGFGILVLIAQITSSISGKTAYELKSDVPIKITSSIFQNFECIFGEKWLLNFLFPISLCIKQKGDGTHWKGVKICPQRQCTNNEHTVIDMI